MSDVMSFLAWSEASSASDAANAAKRASNAAKDAAEEKLEGVSGNRMLIFSFIDEDEILDTKKIDKMGFWQKFATPEDTLPKLSVLKPVGTFSIKFTDISHLEEVSIDGKTFTRMHFEKRCNLNYHNLLVEGSLLAVSTYINNGGVTPSFGKAI